MYSDKFTLSFYIQYQSKNQGQKDRNIFHQTHRNVEEQLSVLEIPLRFPKYEQLKT